MFEIVNQLDLQKGAPPINDWIWTILEDNNGFIYVFSQNSSATRVTKIRLLDMKRIVSYDVWSPYVVVTHDNTYIYHIGDASGWTIINNQSHWVRQFRLTKIKMLDLSFVNEKFHSVNNNFPHFLYNTTNFLYMVHPDLPNRFRKINKNTLDFEQSDIILPPIDRWGNLLNINNLSVMDIDNEYFYLFVRAEWSTTWLLKMRIADDAIINVGELWSIHQEPIVNSFGNNLYVYQYNFSTNIMQLVAFSKTDLSLVAGYNISTSSTHMKMYAISKNLYLSFINNNILEIKNFQLIDAVQIPDNDVLEAGTAIQTSNYTFNLGTSKSFNILKVNNYFFLCVIDNNSSIPVDIIQLDFLSLTYLNMFSFPLISDESNISLILNDGIYLYVFLDQRTQIIIKIRMSDMARISTLILPEIWRWFTGATIHQNYCYNISSRQDAILKIRLSDMTFISSHTYSGNNIWSLEDIINDGEHFYIVYNGWPTHIAKIRISDMVLVQTVSFPREPGYDWGHKLTNDGIYLYVVGWDPSSFVVKVRMSDLTIAGQNQLNADEEWVEKIVNDGTYLYMVSNSSSIHRVIKIRMSDMVRVNSVDIQYPLSVWISDIVIDTKNLYVLFDNTIIVYRLSNLVEIYRFEMPETYFNEFLTHFNNQLFIGSDIGFNSFDSILKVNILEELKKRLILTSFI